MATTVLAACLFATGCNKAPKPPDTTGEAGIASWYGHPYDGRLTASGEVYDMEKMTAAHRTLRFGTVVRVESLDNHKITEVRITDRGPFVQGRIIDLSHAAAQAIVMPGIANVRLHVVSTPRTRAADIFAVQLGQFSQRTEADQLRSHMQAKYGSAQVVFRAGDQTWRVLVGAESTAERADALLGQLKAEASPAFVVLLDQQD